MSVEENRGLVQRYFEELYNKGDLARLDELVADSYVNRCPITPGLSGSGSTRQAITLIRAAFPDFRVTVEELIAEGDRVASRLTLRGTHKGEFLGIPPTGKEATVALYDIFRISEGKIVERWGLFDQLGLMQQLGVVSSSRD